MLTRFIMLINFLVPDMLLRKLLQQITIKTRSGEPLVTLLIPTDFSCFLSGDIQCLGPR